MFRNLVVLILLPNSVSEIVIVMASLAGLMELLATGMQLETS